MWENGDLVQSNTYDIGDRGLSKYFLTRTLKKQLGVIIEVYSARERCCLVWWSEDNETRYHYAHLLENLSKPTFHH